MKDKNKCAFTLIELIVVIAIIAILAAIIAPNAFRAIEKAKIAKIEGDFKTLEAAVTAYYADTGRWPPSDLCVSRGGGPNIAVETRNFITGEGQPVGWDGPYIERWPNTPFRPEGAYPIEYYNYIYACCPPHGFCDIAGTADVYLQAGACTEKNARRLEKDLDGEENFNAGSIRYEPARLILYYIIAENTVCGEGVHPP